MGASVFTEIKALLNGTSASVLNHTVQPTIWLHCPFTHRFKKKGEIKLILHSKMQM